MRTRFSSPSPLKGNAMSYTEQQRKDARELLIRSRLYKIVAYAFMGVAFLIFALFYSMFAKAGFLAFVKNPFLIGMILFPFVPAYAFAIMSKNRRSKAIKILSEGIEPGDMSKKRTDLYSSDKM